MKIFVWHENQRAPATLYGKAHALEGFEVIVSTDPGRDVAIEKAAGRRAVCYHFSANGNGSAGA